MPDVKNLIARIDRVDSHLHERKQKESEHLFKVANQKRELVDEIHKIRKNLNERLDALEQKAKNDLIMIEAELQKELKSGLDVLKEHIENLARLKSTLKDNDDITEPEKAETVIMNASAALNEVNKEQSLSLKMVPNSDLISSILNATKLASFDFHMAEEPIIPRTRLDVKKIHEVTVDASNRDHARYISCMCQLQNTDFVLADTNNNELIQVNNAFAVVSSLALEDGPYGLCVIDLEEIAVKLCNKTIQIIQTGSELELKKTIYIGETPYTCGFAFSNGLFWSSGFHGVNVFAKDGSRVRSIVNQINGEKPFLKGRAEDIVISQDGKEVFVADSKDGVLVFGKDGKYRMTLRDDRLQQTKGVAVTDEGLVIVAGFNSKNIIVFNPDLNTSYVLVASKRMPGYPVALYYEERHDRLLVGCNNSKILVFQMKK